MFEDRPYVEKKSHDEIMFNTTISGLNLMESVQIVSKDGSKFVTLTSDELIQKLELLDELIENFLPDSKL